MINWIAVDSTMLTGIAHEGTTLYVRFKKGTEYAYQNVPEMVINELLAADSKGAFFMRRIKGQFEYRQV